MTSLNQYPTYSREINSWALYHWANNAFATTIMAAILPIYYSHVAASTLTANKATAYWGYTKLIFFIVGGILLSRVNEREAIRLAKEEDAANTFT